MANIIVDVIAGLFIGVGCRFFNVPLPGSPSLVEAMLVMATATGYTVTDKYVAKQTFWWDLVDLHGLPGSLVASVW